MKTFKLIYDQSPGENPLPGERHYKVGHVVEGIVCIVSNDSGATFVELANRNNFIHVSHSYEPGSKFTPKRRMTLFELSQFIQGGRSALKSVNQNKNAEQKENNMKKETKSAKSAKALPEQKPLTGFSAYLRGLHEGGDNRETALGKAQKKYNIRESAFEGYWKAITAKKSTTPPAAKKAGAKSKTPPTPKKKSRTLPPPPAPKTEPAPVITETAPIIAA